MANSSIPKGATHKGKSSGTFYMQNHVNRTAMQYVEGIGWTSCGYKYHQLNRTEAFEKLT